MKTIQIKVPDSRCPCCNETFYFCNVNRLDCTGNLDQRPAGCPAEIVEDYVATVHPERSPIINTYDYRGVPLENINIEVVLPKEEDK